MKIKIDYKQDARSKAEIQNSREKTHFMEIYEEIIEMMNETEAKERVDNEKTN